MKAVVDSLDDVPEPIRDEYEERDGKFVLKLEDQPPGFVPKSDLADANGKLAEFRDNNRALHSKLEEAEKQISQFEGIDPEEHKSMAERLAKFESKGAKSPEDIEARVQAAVEAAVGPVQEKLSEITEREKQTRQELAQKELESTLTEAGLKAGVDEKALPDFLGRAKQVFQYEDGKVVAKEGGTPRYSEQDPTKPLTPTEWAQGLKDDASHLFKPSKGGGAGGGPGSGVGAKRTVSNDPLEIGKNLEDLAAGKATIQ